MIMPTRTQGYALLNALLGIMLLTGIVYLVMHTMGKYHEEQNAHVIGEELAPFVSALITTDLSARASNVTYPLVAANAFCSGNPLLSNISAGYLQSLKDSGFDLSTSACVLVQS